VIGSRSPLPRVSKKRARENRIRAGVLRPMRQLTIRCPRCNRAEGLNGHELKSRAQGGSITDPANIILLCNPCNTWCEDNPREAAEQGWKISRKWDRKR
jgi:5-methylcytosine-specific restriction endonuclease McrA